MPYVAFASTKASPGVTTTIGALSASWPAHRVLHLVELDPAGGDLAVRFDLAPEPGLVGLAAAGRRGVDLETFLAHTQPLPAHAGDAQQVRRVLVGPVSPEQAKAALTALRGGLSGVLSSIDADVLVDCGRLDPGSPSEVVACSADLLVMVVRPVVAEVHHLITRVASLRPRALGVLLVGEHPYSVSEVAQAVGAMPFGTLPDDPRAAMALNSGATATSGALRRSRLLRTSRSLAEGLSTWLASLAPPEPPRPALPPGPSRTDQWSTMAPQPPPPPPAPQPSPPTALPAPAAPESTEHQPTGPLVDELTKTGPIPIVHLPPPTELPPAPPRPAPPKHYRSNGKGPGR